MFSILLLIDDNLQVKVNYIIKFEICPAFIYEPVLTIIGRGGGGGYSQKTLVGVYGPLPKTLTLLITKICNFPYSIYDQTKNLTTYSVFTTVAADTVALNIIFEGVLFMVLSIMIASSKQHYSRLEYKTHTLFKTKVAKVDPHL